MIEDESGMRLQGLCQYLGTTTNNEAEYLALIAGLKAAREWNPDRLEVYLDSKLVVEQMNGRYNVKEQRLRALHKDATDLLNEYRSRPMIAHVEREKNRGADALANKAIDARVPKSKFGG